MTSLEKLVFTYREPSLHLIRLNDATSFRNYRGPDSPFDFVGSYNGHPLALECKETGEESIPVSQLKRKKSIHQFEALTEFAKAHTHCIAGYLCQTSVAWFFVDVLMLPAQGSLSHDNNPCILRTKPFHLSRIICRAFRH